MPRVARSLKQVLQSCYKKKAANFATNRRMPSKTSEFMKCLEDIAKSQTTYTCGKVVRKTNKLLSLVFHIGEKQLRFKKEEKQKIGPLLTETLRHIRFNIKWENDCPLSRHSGNLFMKKRALQYLISDFSDFPVGSTTLAVKFNDFHVNELIKRLDYIKAREILNDIDELDFMDPNCDEDYVKYLYGILDYFSKNDHFN